MSLIRKGMQIVRIPQLAWYGDSELALEFPASWQVTICHMKGEQSSAITEAGIRAAFAHPNGTRPLRELARGKKEVAIFFDDMTRPTQFAPLMPFVLEELTEGGIDDKGIRFIAAVGCHRGLNRIEFVKKLGEDVLDKYPVYNHNCYENCTYLGKTSRGTPVSINSEVMNCDLRIGMGSIVPHILTGFGGGAKIVLPGISHIDTVETNHGMRLKLSEEDRSQIGWGRLERNPVRLDMEEAAKIAGVDFLVNAIVNLKRETVALFTGDIVDAYKEGAKMAMTHYATQSPNAVDVVIVNAYSKGSEAYLVTSMAAPLLKPEGGYLVIIDNAPDGTITHYLNGYFGKNMGGRNLQIPKLPPGVKKMIVLSSFIDLGSGARLAPPEAVWVKEWSRVLEDLETAYPDGAEVAVIPDGTIQYFVSP